VQKSHPSSPPSNALSATPQNSFVAVSLHCSLKNRPRIGVHAALKYIIIIVIYLFLFFGKWHPQLGVRQGAHISTDSDTNTHPPILTRARINRF
jgi:hypothetical protein